jgi:hypothetical protein
MRRSEQHRSTRKILVLGLAISAVAHAAALAWLALPIRGLPESPATIAILTPLAEPIPVVPIVPVAVTPLSAASASGGAGAAGGAPARPAPESAAPVENATPVERPAESEVKTLAVADSLPIREVAPLVPVQSEPVVVAALPERAPTATTNLPAVHTPGSVGGAKDRWAGTLPGTAGAGATSGKGGVGVTVGRPGTKRHPPIGLPGRGRGGW